MVPFTEPSSLGSLAPMSEPATPAAPPAAQPAPPAPDLDRIERELAGVEAALARLDAGTSWTDEVTGAPIPEAHLAAHPIARRAPE